MIRKPSKPFSTVVLKNRVGGFFLIAAVAICFITGIAMILETFSSGDGDWFWYAKLARSGFKLYSDLHLPFQPAFPLETIAFQNILGESWLASKVPALINLCLFIAGIVILVKACAIKYYEKAIVILFAFFIGIRFEWYRFDDYHILCDILFLFTAIIIRGLTSSEKSAIRAHTLTLGALAGLSFANRPNDGAALIAFDVVAILLLKGIRDLRPLAICIFTFLATVIGLVSATSDSISAWVTNSITNTASVKGGTGLFVLDPLIVISRASTYVFSTAAGTLMCLFIGTLAILVIVHQTKENSKRKNSVILIASGIIAIGSFSNIYQPFMSGSLELSALSFGVTAAYIVGFFAITRIIDRARKKQMNDTDQQRDVILLLPIFICAGWSLSTAGNFYQLYFPIALLVILVSITEFNNWTTVVRHFFSILLSVLFIATAFFKINNPAVWQNYIVPALTARRVIAQHPNYGPIIIDPKLLAFSSQICALVKGSGDPHTTLLSIPWTYGNFYCAIPPWKNYVQTWFDTTPQNVVENLTADLSTTPPDWILYQRQPIILTANEQVYNAGRPLAQRALDTLIMGKISSGSWNVVFSQSGEYDGEWLLIKTHQTRGIGTNLIENPSASEYFRNWHILDDRITPKWSVVKAHSLAISVRKTGTFNSEALLDHPLRFTQSGLAIINLIVSAKDLVVGDGNGYSVELIDNSMGQTIAHSGFRTHDRSYNPISINAKVNKRHDYSLRLHFSAIAGDVDFSRISIRAMEATSHLKAAMSDAQKLPADAWNIKDLAPAWYASHQIGGFIVQHELPNLSQSTLFQNLSFKKSGLIKINATVKTDVTLSDYGYGYQIALINRSTNAPICSSNMEPNKHIADVDMVASVKAGVQYQLQLSYYSGKGTVSFSNLSIKYAQN